MVADGGEHGRGRGACLDTAVPDLPFSWRTVRQGGRKTASIAVSPDNAVTVTVPVHLEDEAIRALVHRKRNWIHRKIAFNNEVRLPHKPKEYVSGEAFTYIGRNYRLKVIDGDEPGVQLRAGRFGVQVPATVTGEARTTLVAESLRGWYREHARQKLAQRARMHAKRMGLTIGDVGVRDYRRQWGSCHQDGSVHFNWTIIIAPLSIIDYVVIHELCHLVHRNHSKQFWQLLGRHLPDYAIRKDWLRVNGGLLGV